MLSIDPAAVARAGSKRRFATSSGVSCAARGVVVGLSGGIDSSVVGVLAARALGPEHVLGLLMPEADSSPDSETLAPDADNARSTSEASSRTSPAILTAAGCYRRRDEAIRSVMPEYGDG